MKLMLSVMLILMTLSLSCKPKQQGSADTKDQSAQQTQQAQPVPQAHQVDQTLQAHQAPDTSAVEQAPPQMSTQAHKAVVQQIIQGNYSYLKLKEGDKVYWIATSLTDAMVGQTVSFTDSLEMNNFTSKELNRTFDTIYFVSKVKSESSTASSASSMTAAHQPEPAPSSTKKISVEPAKGGITIAELFTNSKDYGGKTVAVRGQVTKVNRAIMGKNWVHLQDGTEHEGDSDLTVTTLEDAKVGDVVTMQGKIALNKDFGSGYVYDVIMEEATKKAE